MPAFEDACDPGTAVLGHYLEIEAAAHVMLQAARSADWVRVRRVERAIGDLAARLDAAAHRSLDAEQRRERLRVVRRLLAIDAEVRHLADPASLRLDRMFAPRPEGGRQAETA